MIMKRGPHRSLISSAHIDGKGINVKRRRRAISIKSGRAERKAACKELALAQINELVEADQRLET